MSRGQCQNTFNIMTEIEKIDRVLDLIVKCEQPPKRSALDVANEIDCRLTTKESIEILDNLYRDGYIIKEIQANEIAYYFSSFKGRLFLMNGGYQKEKQRQKIESIKNKSITGINIFIAIIVAFLTYLDYKATDKANDNRETELKLKSEIESLKKELNSLNIKIDTPSGHSLQLRPQSPNKVDGLGPAGESLAPKP
jgi:hypothetical protein